MIDVEITPEDATGLTDAGAEFFEMVELGVEKVVDLCAVLLAWIGGELLATHRTSRRTN